MVRRKSKSWHIRQHLETCVFSYVAEELKTGDLCVEQAQNSLPIIETSFSVWEECEPKLADYCQQFFVFQSRLKALSSIYAPF